MQEHCVLSQTGKRPLRADQVERVGFKELFFTDSLVRKCHIYHLAHLPLPTVTGHHYSPQPRIVECDGCGGRGVQQMQRHAVAPDGRAAHHDDEGATGDLGQWRQRLGGGDGRGDGDGVDDGGGHFS
jgi:hypothetical protein